MASDEVKVDEAPGSKAAPESHGDRGRFWGALIGTFVLTLGGNAALTTGLQQNQEKEAKDADAALEQRIAEYINGTLQPALAEELDERDNLIFGDVEETFGEDLKELEDKCLEALVEARTVKHLLERDMGYRRVAKEQAKTERKIEAETEPKAPKPRPMDKKKDRKAKLPAYKAQAPLE